jgi:hypothetical protein
MSTDRETLRKNAINRLLDTYWLDELRHFKECLEEDYYTLEEFTDKIEDHNIYDLICIDDKDVDEVIKELWTDMFNYSHE